MNAEMGKSFRKKQLSLDFKRLPWIVPMTANPEIFHKLFLAFFFPVPLRALFSFPENSCLECLVGSSSSLPTLHTSNAPGRIFNASDLDALMSCLKKEERDFGVDNG